MKIKKKAVIILLIITAVVIGIIYLLFYAYIPPFGYMYKEEVPDMTNEEILAEFPEIAITDEDKAWLDEIYYYSKVQNVFTEDPSNDVYFTLDDENLPHYYLRPEENVEIHVCNWGTDNDTSYKSMSATFSYQGTGIKQQKIFFAAHPNSQYNTFTEADLNCIEYTKAITIERKDGKPLVEYWNSNGMITKTECKHGLINYLDPIIYGIMSV